MSTEPGDLTRYDDLPPSEAVVLAWSEYPAVARDAIRRDMPLLARALDRLVEYEQTPPKQRRPQWRTQPPLWQETSEEEASES